MEFNNLIYGIQQRSCENFLTFHLSMTCTEKSLQF